MWTGRMGMVTRWRGRGEQTFDKENNMQAHMRREFGINIVNTSTVRELWVGKGDPLD
jgi:hypothetical protein